MTNRSWPGPAQVVLTPLGSAADPLPIDATLAGRAFQHVEVLGQDVPGGVRVWLPLLDGAERLGVLGVTVPALEEKLTARLVVGTERLEPGDRVLVYTDGVTEVRSPAGEFFGTRRLTDLLAANLAAGLPTPETMRRLIRALLECRAGRLRDDLTMLLVEWRTGTAEANVP